MVILATSLSITTGIESPIGPAKPILALVSSSTFSNEAKETKVGNTIKIRLQNSETAKAEIENIIEEADGSRTITIKITEDVEKITAYRKISFDIIWWNAEGFRVPNDAIREENGLSYVVRNRNGYYNKMLVKILRQNDEYCIVRAYKTEELKDLELL